MDKPSGAEIGRLISQGWVPPKIDYDAWREPLAIWNEVRGYPSLAESLRNPDHRLTTSEREEMDALALALKAAPKDSD